MYTYITDGPASQAWFTNKRTFLKPVQTPFFFCHIGDKHRHLQNR